MKDKRKNFHVFSLRWIQPHRPQWVFNNFKSVSVTFLSVYTLYHCVVQNTATTTNNTELSLLPWQLWVHILI